MKLESVTKIDKRSQKALKKFGTEVMSINCNVIAIF